MLNLTVVMVSQRLLSLLAGHQDGSSADHQIPDPDVRGKPWSGAASALDQPGNMATYGGRFNLNLLVRQSCEVEGRAEGWTRAGL